MEGQLKFDDEMAKAEKRVLEMDGMDGFPDRFLPTIAQALRCGLRHRDGSEFDALFMLDDLVSRLRRGEECGILP